MILNRKGFAITGILYTILILFLLLLSSLLAILSTRVNRLNNLNDKISNEIMYNEEIDNIENIITINNDYYITNYRGKYLFDISYSDGSNCTSYSYMPNNTLLHISDGKIKYKYYPNNSQCMIDPSDSTDFSDLNMVNCDNNNISAISFNAVFTSQDKEDSLNSDPLSKLGLNDLLNSDIPDFSITAIEEEGIYSAEDDIGVSYYFRGASTRNYVKFGKHQNDLVKGYTNTYNNSTGRYTKVYKYYSSMTACNNAGAMDCTYLYHKDDDIYWRIVRINGDGTLRIIADSIIDVNEYDGSKFDYVEIKNNNKVDSDIKGVLDSWYERNILEQNYDSYITDSLFCNDLDYGLIAVVDNDNNFQMWQYCYGAKYRLNNYKAPSFICGTLENPEKWKEEYNQKYPAVYTEFVGFEFSDNKKYSVSNGNLKYPIGLLTADEFAFAGGVLGSENTSFYLYNGNSFWTMSPSNESYLTLSNGYRMYYYDIYKVTAVGGLSSDRVTTTGGIRPVINLRNDISFTGTGTKNDPFIPIDICE